MITQTVIGQTVVPNEFGDDIYLNEDSTVEYGTCITQGNLVVENNLVLENYGQIETDIIVNNADLMIKNNGGIFSNFYLNDNATVSQIISGDDAFNLIDFDVDYNLFFENLENDLNIATVSDFIINADNVIMKNTALDFSGAGLSELKNLKLNLSGVIILKLDDVSEINDGVLFDNIDGNPIVHLIADNQNNLFINYAYTSDGKLYVGQKRETDYMKIFDDDLGVYLNDLRVKGENVQLLNRLDSASTVAQFYDIMNESILFSPNKLIQPIKIKNIFDKNNDFYSCSGVNVFALVEDDFNIYGTKANFINYDDNNFLMRIGGQFGVINFSSDIDSFKGELYSLDLGMKTWLMDDLFLGINVAAGAVSFDVGDVLYNNVIYNDPELAFGYLTADIAYELKIDDFLRVMPYLGVDLSVYDTNELSELEFNTRFGSELLYAHEIMGLRYEYAVRVFVGTIGEMGARITGGFFSVEDSIGGDIGFSVVSVYDKISYEISAGVNIEF